MRAFVAWLLVLAAPLAAAGGNDACEPETTTLHPADEEHVWLDVEQRDCEGARSTDVAAQDPEGRTVASWFDDERGVGITAFRSPRFVYWVDDERGCTMIVNTFGATELPCVAGAPPSPAQVPR
ncbi:MAG TPA: hypothetical protein VM370_04385 [Candidatus Thermoplasmatota archaeon]|nr:hypothetical protein [Candidatus Thermoplasmatota archaeon]